jgi:hypothetical protein
MVLAILFTKRGPVDLHFPHSRTQSMWINSEHPGRRINDNIDIRDFARLVTRNGGELTTEQ